SPIRCAKGGCGLQRRHDRAGSHAFDHGPGVGRLVGDHLTRHLAARAVEAEHGVDYRLPLSTSAVACHRGPIFGPATVFTEPSRKSRTVTSSIVNRGSAG